MRGGRSDSAMTIEVLCFDACLNHETLLPQLEQLLRTVGIPTRISLRRIADEDEAEREHFLGSPTVRVDGRDIEPGAEAREDFGLKCRLYQLPERLHAPPSDDWALDALMRTKA
jgi:hypothetical protein